MVLVKRVNYGVKEFQSLAQEETEIYFSVLKEKIKEEATKLFFFFLRIYTQNFYHVLAWSSNTVLFNPHSNSVR